jgi:hypothetical protein
VTIKSVTEEMVRDPKSGQQTKRLIARFAELEDEQGLILNATNRRALRAKFGDDTDASIGKPVILYLDQTAMGPGVRIRFPETKARKAAAQTSNVEQFAKGGKSGDGAATQVNPDDDLNDEMPF